MLDTNTAILAMDSYLSSKFNKGHHYASQKKQLALLSNHYSKNICRRTLCRYRAKQRAALETEGIKRHVKGEDGKPKFRSTITYLLKKGYALLRKAVRELTPLIKQFSKWTTTSKKETPQVLREAGPESPHPSREEVAFKWKEMRLSLFPDQLTTSP